MPSPDSYCYCWRDDAKRIAVVFVGDAKAPERRWHARNEFESDANLWLRTLDKQPEPGDGSMLWPDFGNRMRTIALSLTAQLTEQGYDVLSFRDYSTVKAGYQKRRPVYITDSFGKRRWFRSVNAAARALGKDPSTITLAAQDPKRTDIQYADAAFQK